MEEKRKGEIIIFFEALLWAFFPVITVLSYCKLPSLIAFGWTTLFSAVFFGLFVTYKKRWRELKDPLVWKYSVLSEIFIGVLFLAIETSCDTAVPLRSSVRDVVVLSIN